MDLKNIVDKSAKSFYKNYLLKNKVESFILQAKILSTASLLTILETELQSDAEHVRKICTTISNEIDEEIFSNPKVMADSKLSQNDKSFLFSQLAIKRMTRRLDSYHQALAKGSLDGEHINHFKDLLYVTYIGPLSNSDDEYYFEQNSFELLRLKPIFINDYFDLRNTLKGFL